MIKEQSKVKNKLYNIGTIQLLPKNKLFPSKIIYRIQYSLGIFEKMNYQKKMEVQILPSIIKLMKIPKNKV